MAKKSDNKALKKANKNSLVCPDGSWNMNNRTVASALSKYGEKPSPLHPLVTSETSKLMADHGKRLDFADTVLRLGRTRPSPTTGDELVERLYEYFSVCQHNEIPPSYPLFSVWCGMSIEELEGKHSRLYNIKDAVSLCRETIRGFLELSAMDNALSPLIYFHQQKVYFGAVETAKVQIEEVKSDEEKLRELDSIIASIQPIDTNVIDIKTKE